MIYKDKQNGFDKEVRKANEHINELSEMNSYIWKRMIQKYCVPKRRADTIPMEILNVDGTTSSATEDVHRKWIGEFKKIYEFDEQFLMTFCH